MEVKWIESNRAWRKLANSARTTINMESGENEPTSKWKKRMLLCEHSPIRKLKISCCWAKIKYWVVMHLVRHKVGIEHWVGTQRTDRTNTSRDEKKQSALVSYEIEANAQAIISTSRKRLCTGASPETRIAWMAMLDALKEIEPELYEVCVPDCIYRGYCYEFISCDYHTSEDFKRRLKEYRSGINE